MLRSLFLLTAMFSVATMESTQKLWTRRRRNYTKSNHKKGKTPHKCPAVDIIENAMPLLITSLAAYCVIERIRENHKDPDANDCEK